MMTVCIKVSASTSFSLDFSCLVRGALPLLRSQFDACVDYCGSSTWRQRRRGRTENFFLHGYGRYVCREAQVTESNSDRGYVR